MTLALRLMFLIIGIFLFVDGTFFAFYSNFNIGTILTIAMGAFLIVCGICLKKILAVQKRGLKILQTVIAAGLCIAVVFSVFLFIYGINDTVTYDEDVLIVLGAGVNGETPTEPLAARLDAAVEYMEKNPDAAIIVTGGQGPQEDITEAEAMARHLIANGIPEEEILREEKSTSTSENFKLSKQILDDNIGSYSAAVITNEFHIYRAKRLAELAGLEVTTLHAPTPWYSAPAMYIREWLAVIKLWIFKY